MMILPGLRRRPMLAAKPLPCHRAEISGNRSDALSPQGAAAGYYGRGRPATGNHVAMRVGEQASEAHMTVVDGIIIAFALLIGGILLPVSSGVRSTLVLALIVLTVLAVLGGGMEYVLGFFQ
jgi:hypothetical protein